MQKDIFPKSTKKELIQKWKESVHKLEQQIVKLQEDNTLSVAERQKKIARRYEIIADYEFSIAQAEDYLRRESQRTARLYEEYMKKK